jgi:hypothetical protein
MTNSVTNKVDDSLNLYEVEVQATGHNKGDTSRYIQYCTQHLGS